jgi:hypothetical protein
MEQGGSGGLNEAAEQVGERAGQRPVRGAASRGNAVSVEDAATGKGFRVALETELWHIVDLQDSGAQPPLCGHVDDVDATQAPRPWAPVNLADMCPQCLWLWAGMRGGGRAHAGG